MPQARLSSTGTLGGVIDNGEHLPAAVLQYSQNGVVGFLGYLPVPAGGDKGASM